MKNRKHLMFFATQLVAGCLLTLTTMTASSEVFQSVSPKPPRQCSLNNLINVVAGPADSSGTLSPDFPKVVSCPGTDCKDSNSIDFNTPPGTYLRWDYLFNFPGYKNKDSGAIISPSDKQIIASKLNDIDGHPVMPPKNAKLYLSVSDDTSVSATLPLSINVPSNCSIHYDIETGHTACESHILGFPLVNGASNQQFVSFLTPVGYSSRIASAGAKLGGDEINYCLIAGAGKVETQNQVTVESQIVSTPGCDVKLTKDSSGHVSKAEITNDVSENCKIKEYSQPPSLCDADSNGNVDLTSCKPVVGDLPSNGLTTKGSCNYSYTNTMGGKTTIACTGCCIQPSTNKCVLMTGSPLTCPK